MKEILASIASAKERLEAVRVDIFAIKDEDVAPLSDIATQLTEVKKILEESRSSICIKQENYFHLLASCVLAIKNKPEKMPFAYGEKFQCCDHWIFVNKDSTSIHVSGGSYGPDEIETTLFVSLCEAMIDEVLLFPNMHQIEQEKLGQKIDVTHQVVTKIRNLFTDKSIREILAQK